MKPARPKIGLALSGGAARGIAHIGALKVLEEHNFPIDFIAGTSMGSIVAGAYASGMKMGLLEEIALSIRWRDASKVSFSKLAIMTNDPLEQMLRRIMPVSDFAKMRIPLAIVTADIQIGQAVVFTKGDAVRAIRISCSVPGFFAPVIDEQGRMLVDGGIVQNLPIDATLALGAEKVIGIDVNSKIEMLAHPTNIFQLLMQSYMVIGRGSAAFQASHANLIVEPNTGRIRVDELEKAKELIAAGEAAMLKALPQAMALLENV
jgi:NTE family protein